MPLATSLLIFLGTYTPAGGESRGIYSVRLDPVSGHLSEPVLVAATPNPTFLAWHPDGRTLYALSESGTVDGKAGGALAAFRYDAATGSLSPLNTEATGGIGLAHVAVDASGRTAAVISYNGGYTAAFPLLADGRLGARTSLIPHTGPLGPHAQRQDKPHPHSITYSPDNRFVYVCDLGLDRVFHYRLDPAAATLTPAGTTATAPGAGPRHSKFSADGRFLYVINELNGTIGVFAAEPASGALTPVQAIGTLPADFTGTSICAEIRLSPDGRFVYGSNRGHDSLVVFARDAAAGTLTLVEIVPTGGKHPRNFNLSPDGRWLVCGNRDSNNVTVFAVNPASGRLTRTAQTLSAPQAVCVLFAP
ncbi:6-phosphogluconolactonase [Lacunisphaera limnophila]|uniref:6-phosphogluconolactonase n=1 Tax=Lacunisphaera limnophila TaxID=1838286 RepID=A0A1D8AR60_9BACT|nr:lactonase family protein [Lacunisphaera limnophila]AOS43374.1 6-phosphogluconolactonase [Lacunisphaera limnophila]